MKKLKLTEIYKELKKRDISIPLYALYETSEDTIDEMIERCEDKIKLNKDVIKELKQIKELEDLDLLE